MKSDVELYKDVKDKLDFEPGVDPKNITYSARNGVVTVNGTVGTYLEKHLIKRAIRRIQGVRAIADEVVVEPISTFRSNDTEIANSALRVIDWDISLPKDKIKVTVENGRITLTGQVPWYYQKQSAERDVRYLAGVTAVDNQIEIKPVFSISTPVEVKEKIKKEFERHALIDAQNISVEIDGSKIILKGHVESWAEAKEASHIAWSIPGVSYVDNQIIINDITYNSQTT